MLSPLDTSIILSQIYETDEWPVLSKCCADLVVKLAADPTSKEKENHLMEALDRTAKVYFEMNASISGQSTAFK